jgi:hypothetical protein
MKKTWQAYTHTFICLEENVCGADIIKAKLGPT